MRDREWRTGIAGEVIAQISAAAATGVPPQLVLAAVLAERRHRAGCALAPNRTTTPPQWPRPHLNTDRRFIGGPFITVSDTEGATPPG